MKPNLQPSAETLESVFNDANCKRLGMDALRIMYPLEGDDRAEAIAKSVCNNCVAFEPCKERGEYEPAGVWAAQTPRDRISEKRSLRTERRRLRQLRADRTE